MVRSIAMNWRHLLFANWPMDPAIVDSHVPDRLTLDTYDGRAWLSVVPFTNVNVRPAFLPTDRGVALPELNLRTYVTVDGMSGVYFFSLDADGIAAVIAARLTHHLPYYYATIDLAVDPNRVRFTARRRHPGARPMSFRATYEPTGDRFYAVEHSLAHFLTERHRYYTESSTGELRYAAIDHEQWPLYDATVDIEANALFAANGFPVPQSDPVHLFSPGVDTIATRSKRVEP